MTPVKHCKTISTGSLNIIKAEKIDKFSLLIQYNHQTKTPTVQTIASGTKIETSAFAFYGETTASTSNYQRHHQEMRREVVLIQVSGMRV